MRHLANAHSVTGPAGSIYRTSFFWRLAGPVAPTGKAIVHWIGCINTIKIKYCIYKKKSIRDARTPQPGEIVFNTMRYTSSETVQRLGYFQSSVNSIKLQISRENNI